MSWDLVTAKVIAYKPIFILPDNEIIVTYIWVEYTFKARVLELQSWNYQVEQPETETMMISVVYEFSVICLK